MARPRGFEPPTPSSGGWCSIQLSYRRACREWPELNVKIGRGERIRTSDPLLPKQVRYQAAPHPAKPPSIPGGWDYVAASWSKSMFEVLQFTGPLPVPGTQVEMASGSRPIPRIPSAQES
jgi:hypothetical protein